MPVFKNNSPFYAGRGWLYGVQVSTAFFNKYLERILNNKYVA